MKRGKFGEIRWDVITFIIVLFVTFIFFIGSDLKITGFDTFTTTAVPDVPTLILPNNDSRLLFNANNGFNWSGSDSEGNPMNYFLQIGNSTGFENGNLSVNITLNNANITLLSNNLSIGKYYWRVRANDSEGITRSFYESNINNPSTQFLRGYPTPLKQSVNMNISVNFTTDVLMDYVNLS